MYKTLLVLILLLSLSVRIYHFNSPMADLHSWRQADTASVARNLVLSNFDVLHPQIESAVSIDGIGRDNTPRYHFAEFPLYQALVAAISIPVVAIKECSLTDGIVYAGRIVSIVSSLLSMFALYLLTRRYYQEKVALLAALVFGLLPYAIFWSRTILPDSMMLMFSIFMLYWVDVWVRGANPHEESDYKLKWLPFMFAVICFSLALLLKAFVPFLLLPVFYLLWMRLGRSFPARKEVWLFLLIAVLPFMLWRYWMQSWPYSIPASGWLFDGNHIRFKPAWWHWIFQMRLDQFMFNFSGLFMIVVGLVFYNRTYNLIKAKSGVSTIIPAERWYLPLCLFSCLIYLIVFATGNVQHEYYQLPLTAFGSIFLSAGFWYLWMESGSRKEEIARRVLVVFLVGLTLMLGWYSVKDWYVIGNPMLVTVGKRADRLLGKDAMVIADYGGDTTFLYYVNREGWSVRDKQLQEIIDRGATTYISMHRDDYINRLSTLYEIIDETPEYVILDLTRKKGDWTGIRAYEL